MSGGSSASLRKTKPTGPSSNLGTGADRERPVTLVLAKVPPRVRCQMVGVVKRRTETREHHVAVLSTDTIEYLKTLEDYQKTEDFLGFHSDSLVIKESYALTKRSFEEQGAMDRQKLEAKLAEIAKAQFHAGINRRGWRDIERQYSLYRYRHIMTTAEMKDVVAQKQQKLWRERQGEDEHCTKESMPEKRLQRT